MALGSPYVALPDTEHSVFYAYSITYDSIEIGSFEKFGQRSTRTVDRIREVMYSSGPKVIDMVWGGTDITLDLSRVELYNEALLEVFGITSLGLEYFNKKVEISEVQVNPKTFATRILTFMKCVPSDFGKDIDTGTARVIETMTFQASYVEYDTGTATE